MFTALVSRNSQQQPAQARGFAAVRQTRIGILVTLTLALCGTLAGTTRAEADATECTPRLVRAVTHFPENVQQFHGDGVVVLTLEVDGTGRVTRVTSKIPVHLLSSLPLRAQAHCANGCSNVNACRAFPARAIVRVEYQRPPVHTFSASRVKSRDLAAALPADGDCTRNPAPRFAGDSIVSCIVAKHGIVEAEKPAIADDAERNPDVASFEAAASIARDDKRRSDMKSLFITIAMLPAVLAATPAPAAGQRPFYGEAVLATPVGAPKETSLDGVTWRCEEAKCVGTADSWWTLDSHMKECRKVAEALGTLTSYRSRSRAMSPRNVTACNRGLS